MSKIKSFTDLNAWQEAHKLAIQIYKSTESFPVSEQFGLTNQMRRCAVSITSNIAEGFSRQSPKEKKHFYSIARGSNSELQSQLMLARDVGFLSLQDFQAIADQSTKVQKIIFGLSKSSSKVVAADAKY